MDVVGRHRIDGARQDAGPQGFAVGRRAQGRVDLGRIAPARLAAVPVDVMGQVVRAGLEEELRARLALAQARSQGLAEEVCTT